MDTQNSKANKTIKPQFVGEKICLNQVVLSLPASKAVIKKNAATEYADGLYPAFSASGQDVWLPDYRYDCNGVVVSAVGARCGKAFKASGKWNVVANTHPLALDEEKIDWDYAWRLLNNENWWIKSGSGQPFVKVRESLKRNIYLPPLSVQKKFAANLERVEKQIALTKQSLAELDSLVKSRFIEMFEVYAREGNTAALSELCEFVTVGIANAATHAYANDGIVMLRNLNVRENHLDDSDLIKINPNFAAKYSKKTLKAGDVLVTRTGYPGIACVVPEKYAGCQTFTTLIARLKSNAQIIPLFLSFWINSPAGKEFVERMKAGSSQQNFGATSLKLLEVPLPPLELQQEFASFVSQVDKLRFKTQQQIEKLEMLKASLMQEYFE